MLYRRRAPLRIAAFAAGVLALAAIGWIGRSAVEAQSATAAAPLSDAARGRDIYLQHCVECHGESGRGDGPASFMLVPRPRDFTLARYKIRSTETGSLPTDTDLQNSIRNGLYGSAMPAWDGLLSNDDIIAVSGFLKTLSPRFAGEQPAPIAASNRVVTSPESVARGGAVYEKLQCGKCHGTDGKGTGAVVAVFEDDWRQPLRAANLTEPWTFHGGASAADVFMRFSAGMSGTPMPSFKGTATDEEMWDLANYVVSLARKPVWEMTPEEIASFYEASDAAARADPVKRGAYLVDTLGCAMCHTPIDEQRRAMPGMRMAGGLRIRLEPFGDYSSGNLTSDRATGLGTWSDGEIKQVITRGILRDGSRLLPYPMDWPSFSSLSATDLDAIVKYLQTLPPIVNDVPAPSRTAFPLYLWGKFRMLVLGNDPPMIFYPGNAGSVGAKS